MDGRGYMTKLAKIMNDFCDTEGYTTQELIEDGITFLDRDEFLVELIRFIYYLDGKLK